MSNFVDKLILISNEVKLRKENLLEEKIKKFEKQKLERKEELFIFLTDKYHNLIKEGIIHAAKNGKREKYMNFKKDDFKANYPSLGYPCDVQEAWLSEVITNPASIYLPRTTEDDIPEHMYGLKYEIWNNKNFTTRFSW